jgi:hypothetical protein
MLTADNAGGPGMTRSLITLTLVALLSTALHADITLTSVTTLEGGAAAMAGNVTPRMVMRIKGMKARTEIEVMGQTIATVADLATREVYLLHADQKTAQLINAVPNTPGAPPPALPKMDGTFKPTGRTQSLDGVSCDEYAFTMSMSMGEMTNAQMPPEAAAMLQDMRMLMSGSIWMAKNAPGAAEYVAFQKAALEAHLASIISGAAGGMSPNGMDKVMRALSGAEGMPYLTEMTMNVEGSGPAVEMMKQMGAMKMTNKVTAVSTDPIPDDMFTVPADYKIVKQ